MNEVIPRLYQDNVPSLYQDDVLRLYQDDVPRLYQDVVIESAGTHPVINLLVPKSKLSLVEKFEQNTEETRDQGCCLEFDNACCSLLSKWWNVHYKWQRGLLRFIEQPMFHIVIIGLVLIDCLLVIAQIILDFIKFKKICDSDHINKTAAHKEHEHHQIELAVEVLHYSSLVLLAMFVVEVFIKIFAFGRHWWSFHHKKMEWLDAIVVLASFALDIVIMYKDSIFAEISLLFISLRLWRLTRIINSVAQTIRNEEETKKKHLAASYSKLIELLLNIGEKKSLVISDLGHKMISQNDRNIIGKVEALDRSCRSILQDCHHTSSLSVVNEMAHRLQDVTEKLQLEL
ncbi:unnamed protein product [Rotaria magnacalcarata]|uniref:Voltage-gated hydrogen channel 1 n=3 Tax=Rotaria magnacalcarata TaxID=392030 RepID=A0A815ZA31_9BILA|nr:unnamed protein product [Rotaria magnacalcarata]CAF3967060.1 unnamed protein product [Rotaria magnacalcarata]